MIYLLPQYKYVDETYFSKSIHINEDNKNIAYNKGYAFSYILQNEWLFMVHDCAYWNDSGPKMFFGRSFCVWMSPILTYGKRTDTRVQLAESYTSHCLFSNSLSLYSCAVLLLSILLI